jgi:hypothetical protein
MGKECGGTRKRLGKHAKNKMIDLVQWSVWRNLRQLHECTNKLRSGTVSNEGIF